MILSSRNYCSVTNEALIKKVKIVMSFITNITVFLIAVLHLYFLVLQIFFWTKPIGMRTFRRSEQQARDSASLAANQGLYNGFLSAGLIWGLLQPDLTFANQIKIFFLVCIAAAGIFGGITANKKIFFVQALPAVIALSFLFL